MSLASNLMKKMFILQEDRIGLKALDESGRLDLVEVEGDHLQIGEEVFVNDFALKYLNN